MALPTDYLSRFKELKPVERRLLAALVIVVSGVMSYNMLLKPNIVKIAALQKQVREADAGLSGLSGSSPQAAQLSRELDDLTKNINSVKDRTKDTETKLLGEPDVPRLVNELIRCAQGLSINFASVAQKTDQDKSGLSRQFVTVKFDAGYAQMLNYLSKVESVSGFVRINEVNIIQSKDTGHSTVSAAITLSALLSNNPEAHGQINPCGAVTGPGSAVTRDPMASSVKVEKVVKKPNFKIIGITFSDTAAQSTAIINDNVVRQGEKVEGYTVKEIRRDSVLLDGEAGPVTLIMERG